MKSGQFDPPQHLSAESAAWWRRLVKTYVLEPHHLSLLQLACESWDRCQQARRALKKHGNTFTDRWDQPKPRPEIAIERDSRLAFARILRELALDDEPTPDVRVPRLHGAG